jgi:hypothetical protein
MNNDPLILGSNNNNATAITQLTANLPAAYAFEVINNNGHGIQAAVSADVTAGVAGFANQGAGSKGVYGQSDGPAGSGVVGNWFPTNGGNGSGVRGLAGGLPDGQGPIGFAAGVEGIMTLGEGYGVRGTVFPVGNIDQNDAVGVLGEAAVQIQERVAASSLSGGGSLLDFCEKESSLIRKARSSCTPSFRSHTSRGAPRWPLENAL